MNAAELHKGIDLELQEVGSFAFDDFQPEEIDYFLNNEQEEIIDDIISTRTGKTFQSDVKSLMDLLPLHEFNYRHKLKTGISSTKEFLIPSRVYYPVNIRVALVEGESQKDVAARIIESVIVYHNEKNPFARSGPFEPSVTLEDKFIRVHNQERFIYKGIVFDYIRRPKKICLASDQTSELPEHLHKKLVARTVQKILSVIASPQYSAQLNENQLKDN